jgi:hypothetical protein
MHVPGLLERVHVSGLDERYLVIRVDDTAQEAGPLPVVYGRHPQESVLFVVIEAIPGCDPPRLRDD